MSGSQQPQGQQNPLSSFGFKPADTSNTTSPNPSGGFGAFAATPSPFGGGNAAQNNATNNSGTAAAPKAPLFGSGGFGSAQNPSPSVQQPASTGGGIFGSSSGGQTSNLFGGTPKFGTTGGSTATNPAPSPLFGGATTQSTAPSTTSGTAFGGASNTTAAPLGGGLFGSTANNQPAPTGVTSASGGTNNSTPSGANSFGNAPSKAPSGGLFGGTGGSGTSNPNPQPTLNIFGASNNNQPSSTQTAGTAGNSNAPATPSTPNLFGNAPSTTPTSTPAQPSPFGNFGAKPADASNQSGASAAPSTGGQSALPSLFGGINTANKSSTPLPSENAAPSTTPSSNLPSLFANLPKKPETPPISGGTSTAIPSAFSGFANLTAPKDATKEGEKDANAGFSLGGNKDADASKAPAASGNSGATAPGPSTTAPTVSSVPAPSMLRGKTVEDIVNRWTTELETHTREFSQFASEVAVWDRTLIENGNYISALYATVLAAESTQASLDQSLDHVEQQQRHLTATLDQYEKSASEILHGPGGIMTSTEGLGLADSERDKSYAMAANLYTQLDDLSRSLTQMVESVNGLNLSPGPSQGSEDGSQEDAISTIAGILNAHLSSLQWIDGALNEMDGKVKDAERKIKDTGARSGARTDGMSKGRSYGLGR